MPCCCTVLVIRLYDCKYSTMPPSSRATRISIYVPNDRTVERGSNSYYMLVEVSYTTNHETSTEHSSIAKEDRMFADSFVLIHDLFVVRA